jgi:hypothetical protein
LSGGTEENREDPLSGETVSLPIFESGISQIQFIGKLLVTRGTESADKPGINITADKLGGIESAVLADDCFTSYFMVSHYTSYLLYYNDVYRDWH